MINDREKESARNVIIDNMNDPDAASARRAYAGGESPSSPRFRRDDASQFSVVVDHPSDSNLAPPQPTAGGHTRS